MEISPLTSRFRTAMQMVLMHAARLDGRRLWPPSLLGGWRVAGGGWHWQLVASVAQQQEASRKIAICSNEKVWPLRPLSLTSF